MTKEKKEIEIFPSKIDWFKSKTDDEWIQYWFSKVPMTEQDKIDMEDYVVWRMGIGLIESLYKEEES